MASNANAHEAFLAALAAELRNARIEAIVVGNTASILNGASVLTQDVDLLVRGTPLNRKKLKLFAAALGGVGPELISGLSSTERIYGTLVPIDILYDKLIGGLTFASIRSRASSAVVGTELLTVAALADIIKSKTAAGRPKDKAVLPMLHDALAVRRAAGIDK
jgi:3',5'-cyclic AMP phosphodiesterase CpdA